MKARNRLRVVLDEHRLTGAETARLTGLPYATVLHLMQPGYDGLLEDALAVCGMLGVRVEEVFWLENAREGG